MAGLVALLLLVPPLAGVAAVVRRSHAVAIARAVGLGSALGWIGVVLATTPDRGAAALLSDPPIVELGQFVVGPVTACAIAGIALLIAALPPRIPLAVSGALTGLTAFAATTATPDRAFPDRRFAVGVVVLVVFCLARLRGERSSVLSSVLVAVGGCLVIVGILADDPELGAVGTLAGAAVVITATVTFAPGAVLLLPVVLLAVARGTGFGADELAIVVVETSGSARVGVVGVGVGAVGAFVLMGMRSRPAVERLPYAAMFASLVLLAQDIVDLRRAGLLLAAASVLAVAGRHPFALLGTVPALVVAVDAAGVATTTTHAAAGAVLAGLLAAALVRAPGVPQAPPPLRWTAFGGVAFGVVPSWGWAGVDLPRYTETLVVAAAVAAGAVVVSTAPRVRRATRPATTPATTTPDPPREPAGEPAAGSVAGSVDDSGDASGRRRRTGRIRRRRSSADPTDGKAFPDDDAVAHPAGTEGATPP